MAFKDENFQTLVAKIQIETAAAATAAFPPGPKYIHYVNEYDPIPKKVGVLSNQAEQTKQNTQVQDTVIAQAEAFGFNRETAFEFPILTSAFPDADQLDGDLAALAQNSLGERDVQATVFQMALVASAIANDGLLMDPYLVARGFDADSTMEWERSPALLAQPIGAGTARVLTDMMERVVTQGTGTRAQIPDVRVAGKTGTAESGGGPPHAWFIGFAPVDDPQIAIAVLVADGGNVGENATGGVVAAPIASTVIDFWLSTDQ